MPRNLPIAVLSRWCDGCAASGPWSSSTGTPRRREDRAPSARPPCRTSSRVTPPPPRRRSSCDTEPATLPPREVIASAAVSRVKPSSEPVTTTDSPASVCSGSASGSSRITQPGGLPLADDLAVPVDGEPVGDRGRPGWGRCPRPSASCSGGRVGQRVDVAEGGGDVGRHALADVPDATARPGTCPAGGSWPPPGWPAAWPRWRTAPRTWW